MRALVLSGGGSKGAWQAGALEVLCGAGRVYDVCCGVSVGALGAAFLGRFPPGEDARAARELVAIWEGLETRGVRRHHFPLSFLHGLWRPSFYDSTPLDRLVRSRLDPDVLRASGRRVRVGAVCLADGRYRLFDESSPHIVDAVLASAAFPAMLEPVAIDGALHIDGGLRDVTPLAAAIDAGATDIDVLLAHPPAFASGPLFEGGRPNALQLAIRSLEILLHEVMENDLEIARRTNVLVREGAAPDHRYVALRVLRPDGPLDASPLSFERAALDRMLARGRRDAEAMLAAERGDAPPDP